AGPARAPARRASSGPPGTGGHPPPGARGAAPPPPPQPRRHGPGAPGRPAGGGSHRGYCDLVVNAIEARVVSQSRFKTPPVGLGSTLIVKRSTTCESVDSFRSILNRSRSALCAVPHCPVSLFTISFQPFAVGSV